MHTSGLNALSAWITLGADSGQLAARDAVALADRSLAALVLIDSHPSCSVEWLHGRLGITQSGTVRLLDRLESAQLITRARQAGRREVAITTTAEGRRRLAHGVAARSRALDDLLTPLSDAERDQLTGLIHKALAGNPRPRDRADTACRLCSWAACAHGCPVDASVASADDPE